MSAASGIEMQRLPVGTVTFLLTDVEGSTQLWQAAPNEMTQAINHRWFSSVPTETDPNRCFAQ